MSKTPIKSSVPARPEGQARTAEVQVQTSLASRTLDKLLSECNLDLDPDYRLRAEGILGEAFREAHCDHTLHNVHWWDLGGQSRIMADGDFSIPSAELPPIGTVLTFNGQTYYVASHKETKP